MTPIKIVIPLLQNLNVVIGIKIGTEIVHSTLTNS